MTYDDANTFLRERLSLPTTLKSRGISEALPPKIRAHCFFSARVAEARVLEKLRSVSDAYSSGELGLTEARKLLQKWLDKNKIGDPADGRISNLSSTMRLDLILRQNAAMAAAVGRYQVSRDPDVEERWPSWRYITGPNPRGSHAVLDGKVFLKSDPFWKSHYPPWDFNCNCDVEDSDEPPQTAPKHDGGAPESGYQFDPADAFGNFDLSSVNDPELRQRITDQMHEKYGDIDQPKKEKMENAKQEQKKETVKLSSEEHKAHRRDQLERAKANRLKQEAKMLNAKLISADHATEEDLAMTNPNFKQGNEYQINCQRSVTTYEARRRGIDVEALPNYGGDGFGVMMRPDGELNPYGWTSAYKNPKAVYCGAKDGPGTGQKVTSQLEDWGDGARAIVRVQWQGGRTGHVFIAENVNGEIRFIDPQTNDMNVLRYFDCAKKNQTYVIRVDKLKFGDNVRKCCKKRGS